MTAFDYYLEENRRLSGLTFFEYWERSALRYFHLNDRLNAHAAHVGAD